MSWSDDDNGRDVRAIASPPGVGLILRWRWITKSFSTLQRRNRLAASTLPNHRMVLGSGGIGPCVERYIGSGQVNLPMS